MILPNLVPLVSRILRSGLWSVWFLPILAVSILCAIFALLRRSFRV